MNRNLVRNAAGVSVYLVTAVYILPLIWLLLAAFKSRAEMFTMPPSILPKSLNFNNFAVVLSETWPYFINSFTAGVFSTVIALLLGIPAAYALARYTLRGSKHIELWILSTKMMPPIAVIIPLFIIFQKVELFDTRMGLVLLYTAFNLPFAVWMLVSFIKKMPKEIEEAALIDGCNLMQTLLFIVLPLIRSGIAVVVIFSFIWTWNDLLFGLIMTQDAAKTLPVALTSYTSQLDIKWELMAALSVLQTIPIVLFTFFSQRHIVSGLTFGGVEK
ncbi:MULTISPECIES: carbohydrate ABC transporter permease [Paenibacillus]|uniref:Mannitol ABC transporter permease n=1 Tax=Paenibacillus naphthalenovorans TaxID=162209 RepID=A0A0U2UGE5_9BACL|nr:MULTISPECIES: carbohydrate ABC transporter permease [Paenibacillus]ALS25112.1 mannitol ABC transporter permease [Paenibacillus naphthalenovorans]SDI35510.1 multiple sugar transport system permease protein/sorbitol/mannitol transport system permease protein [Paenibacillus naphthalenovorans]